MGKFDLHKLLSMNLSNGTLPNALMLSSGDRFSTYYAPFEFINSSAKLVICGITPGIQQALVALRSVQTSLRSGLDHGEALKQAKHAASFAGPMRRNIAEMLDFIGLNRWLGLGSCADLFANRQELIHFTSALKNPVLDQGKNYSGGSAMVTNAYLWDQIRAGLLEEIRMLPSDCIFIPMGRGVDMVFVRLCMEGAIEKDRVLFGVPHASGANAERIAYFCNRKVRSALSNKTDAVTIDMQRARLEQRVKDLCAGVGSQDVQAMSRPASSAQIVSESHSQQPEVSGKVKRIYALGKVKGEENVIFTAKQDRNGYYVLNRKTKSPEGLNTTNHAENKALVATLEEAAELLKSGSYLINVVSERGIRALRDSRKIVIEHYEGTS